MLLQVLTFKKPNMKPSFKNSPEEGLIQRKFLIYFTINLHILAAKGYRNAEGLIYHYFVSIFLIFVNFVLYVAFIFVSEFTFIYSFIYLPLANIKFQNYQILYSFSVVMESLHN